MRRRMRHILDSVLRRLRKPAFGRTEVGWLAVCAIAGLILLAFFGVRDITNRIERVENRTTTIVLPPTAAQIEAAARSVRAELTPVVRTEVRRYCAPRDRCDGRTIRVTEAGATIIPPQLAAMIRAGIERHCAQPSEPCRGGNGRDGADGMDGRDAPAAEEPQANPSPSLDSALLDGVDNRVTDLERLVRPLLGVLCSPALKPVLGLLSVCP